MSHGTTISITFFADEEYPTVAALAAKHRQLYIDKVGDINAPMSYTHNEVVEFFETLAEKKIYVKPARYPNPPINYTTIGHRFNEELLVQALIPFFKELLESEEEDTPPSLSKIVFLFEYENDPYTESYTLALESRSPLGVVVEHRFLPFKMHS